VRLRKPVNCEEPPSELRTRIKRLLELDRSIGRKIRFKDAEEVIFGFFSEEAAGTGADTSFSECDAFALLNGLRIMGHGWPQGFAVSIMRRVRPDLESAHARILRQNPAELFDREKIRSIASAGAIAVDNISRHQDYDVLTSNNIAVMMSSMRTTLTIDDDVAGLLKRRAHELGVPFKDVVNRTLRAGLGEAAKPRRHAAPKTIPHAFGFRPGIDLDKLNQLTDELEAEAYADKMSTRKPRQAALHDPARRQRPRSRP
jgi:hypothetical protein